MASYLPDVNVLLALADRRHVGHRAASSWLRRIGNSEFCLCPITESGFVRLAASPQVGRRELSEAIALLKEMARMPSYRYLPIRDSWLNLVEPFSSRLHGYRQVTDAFLLGLAIRHKAVLITLDQHIHALAGQEFQQHIHTLAAS